MSISMELKQDESTISKLQQSRSNLKHLLKTSNDIDITLKTMDKSFNTIQETLTIASRKVAPLQTLSISNKSVDTRINRAISPALALLDSFKSSESLQRKLIKLYSKFFNEKGSEKRLEKLIKYVDCVDELNDAIICVCKECEPAIQKLQEVVEFLSRIKATDQFRIFHLKEIIVALKAIYESEVEAMRFDGLLDEALMNLQDEFESILLKIRHENIGDNDDDDDGGEMVAVELGSELEIEVLGKISQALAANDCLDICIDIYVKVRYKRAAKTLMRLNPDYLRTYTPEAIDEMEWETLETAITLWIQHFELAITAVFISEKNLCSRVLGTILDGVVWPECFVKIADKIMAVFFRFGEGVTRSSKEPQKLFKLLEMFDSLEKIKPVFSEVFDGEAGRDICVRFRELIKLVVHASTKVFWKFGLQIEGNQDGFPPPQDGSVTKLVRYAINYLKYLAINVHGVPMAKVLKTEQLWKAGVLSKPDTNENLLRSAICNVMEAIQRNVESKRSHCKDKIVANIFAMNTYWYIYMRIKNTELGKLLSEQYIKKRYKIVAEEAAYLYQKQAWGGLVRVLDVEDSKRGEQVGDGAIVRGKIEAFLKGFNEISQRHRNLYNISDDVLREQIRDATIKLVVSAYSEFWNAYKSVLQVKSYLSPESIEEQINLNFDGGSSTCRQLDSRDSAGKGRLLSFDQSRESKDFMRSKSNTSDV